jgi:hypothetical protein
MGGGQTLSQRASHSAHEPLMRGREFGEKATQLGFCGSSGHRSLGVQL